MVDFNAKETIGTPATDIVRILWIQARDNFFQAWESYYKIKLQGGNPGLGVVQARLITLFNEMQAYIHRTNSNKKDSENTLTYLEIYDLVYSDNLTEQNVKDAIHFINGKMDKIQLIKIDTKQRYNRFDMEEENKVFGLD